MKNTIYLNDVSVGALRLFLCNQTVPLGVTGDSDTQSAFLMPSLFRDYVLIAVMAEISGGLVSMCRIRFEGFIASFASLSPHIMQSGLGT